MTKEIELKTLSAGFRDPEVIHSLTRKINRLAAQLNDSIQVMEVCGGHTHTIMKYGLNQQMPGEH